MELNSTLATPVAIVDGQMPSTVAISAPSAVKYGRITVATAGTEVQGPNVPVTQGVTVRGLTGNTGLAYVGSDNAVASTNGYELAQGESVFIACSNLNQLWFDVTTSGNGFSYIGS